MRPLPIASLPSIASRNGLRELAPLAVLVLLVWRFLPFTLDDAWISLRYAHNWASGDGLTFNPGERVEGFSNFAWVALLAVLDRFGLPIPGAAKAIGLLAGLATLLVLARSVTPADGRLRGGLLAAWLLTASGGFAYYAVAGLETALYGLLVLVGAIGFRPSASVGRVAATQAVLLAAAMTRPEGAALFLLATLATVASGRPRARATALISLLPAALLVASRHVYFGTWLPNTYLAKPGVSSLADLGSGLAYAARAMTEGGRLLDLIAAAAALSAFSAWARPLAAAVALGLAFAVWSGGDWMAHSRFVVPYLPALSLLAGAGLARLGAESATRARGVGIGVALLVLLRGVGAITFARDLARGGVVDHAHVATGNVAVGQWLREQTPRGASILTDEIGAIGFHSEGRVLDFWGLIDPEVARRLRAHRFNPYGGAHDPDFRSSVQAEIAELLLARRPDYVVIDHRGPPGADPRLEQVNPVTMRELTALTLARHYTLVRRFVVDARAPKSFLVFRADRPPGERETGAMGDPWP